MDARCRGAAGVSCQTAGGPVAQWLEQATHNRSVVGSIPARPTRFDHLCMGWLGKADRLLPGVIQPQGLAVFGTTAVWLACVPLVGEEWRCAPIGIRS